MKVHDMDKIDLLMNLQDKYSIQKKVYYSNTHVCLSIMPMATCIWTL
jgi:hypothetical protein